MDATDIVALIRAFDRLAAVGFSLDAEWQAAHNLCQSHEGVQYFDWGHALCHRIEGDEWNAGYWYRNAGRPMPKVSFAEEWIAMRAALVDSA